MPRWSPNIFTKGVLLISVPLLFELGFGITLIHLQHEYQKRLDEQIRANMVIAHANEMWLDCTDALSSKMASKIFGGNDHVGYLTSVPAMNGEYVTLQGLLQDQPEDLDRLAAIKRVADAMLAYSDEIHVSTDGGLGVLSSLRENLVVYRRTQKVLGTLGERIRDFRAPWLKRGEAAAFETQRTGEMVERVSVGGIIGSLILAAFMLTYFLRGMYGGIRQLLQNTDRLARHETLIPPSGESDELGNLNTAFFNMAKALEAAAEREREIARMKDDFFNMVSHDMRTPLSSIAIGIESLLTGLKGPVPPAFQETLEYSDENARHLINLITDLLDLEKIQAEGGVQLQLEDVDLHQLCVEAVKVVDPIAKKAGVNLEIAEFDSEARADRHRTMRVLVNLVGNAVKFTPEGKSIKVSCETAEDGLWEISIRDEGKGIPPEKQGLIFDRYRQAELKDATVKGGAGLGLAVCKQLIEAQGGQIGVESDGKTGSRFWFRLPKVVLVPA